MKEKKFDSKEIKILKETLWEIQEFVEFQDTLTDILKTLEDYENEIHIMFRWNDREYDVEIYEMSGKKHMTLTQYNLGVIKGGEYGDYWLIEENENIFRGTNPIDVAITYLEEKQKEEKRNKGLFKIDDVEIYNYELKVYKEDASQAFRVNWEGNIGYGSFTFIFYKDGEKELVTEYMGREFCSEFMEHIFNEAEVEYEEEE